MSAFFSSFEINDMHVQTIFIDLEKPLASVNCYFGLYIETLLLIPSLLTSPEADMSRWIKGALCSKPFSYLILLMLLRERHCICHFRRPKIGTFCSCFYTQKRWSVVYFTHGFLQKKKRDDNIGSSVSHTKRKKAV